MATTVRTKDELESAKKKGVSEILVVGELADKLKKVKKISKLGKGALAVLSAGLIAAPFTGGISMVAATPLAAGVGVSVAAVIAASAIGIALVCAIFKDYEEIECSPGRLVLRKKTK